MRHVCKFLCVSFKYCLRHLVIHFSVSEMNFLNICHMKLKIIKLFLRYLPQCSFHVFFLLNYPKILTPTKSLVRKLIMWLLRTDLCLRQCRSCDITPPPQVRVQAVHLAHSPHQYVVTSNSSSRLFDATPSSCTYRRVLVY